jgi:uncharacterized protein (TIGR02246 family)
LNILSVERILTMLMIMPSVGRTSNAVRERRCRIMNGPTAWRVLVVAGSLALVVAAGEAGEQTGSEDSLAGVRAQVQAYERAWNSHQASAVAVFYARDADMVMGNGPRVEGREAIERWWARYFSAISDNRIGAFQVESLRLLAPRVALANVSTLTAGRGENDEELPPRRARGTWILTANSGQWLISALRGLPAEGDVRVKPGSDR